jgi:tetratricopeptide (TPR) repeat protein
LGAAQAVRGALIAALAVAACRREEPLTEALLAQGGEPSAADRAALELVSERVEAGLGAGRGAAQVLPAVLFGELGFQREVDDPDLRFMRLPAVLASRRGNCYGLTALTLAIAERLGPRHGFSAAAVLVPGHMFVRLADGAGAHNLELLRRGEEMPDAWYRQRYAVPPARAYLRPLTAAELLAVFDYNRGNDLRPCGRLAEAAAAYQRAASAFPDLAEAHASLGLVRQLAGDLSGAMQAYQQARAANPALPGLEKNIALLREELTGAHREVDSPP